ncbi:MAG: helix-turn-helix transcriptional regulator [Eggerthellaceae bacterium]|nr:helix-turn-helix transcriptional regulator [Eggerthellaceae bacterium]
MSTTVMRNSTRIILITTGKACALCVLMLSLSDRISSITGMSYIDSTSFAICAVIALLMTILVKPMKIQAIRTSISIATLCLMLIWDGLVLLLWQNEASGTIPPSGLLLAYATIGRITTLAINFQWNTHISLSDDSESSKIAAASIALSMLIFMMSFCLDGPCALILTIAVGLTSCILNIVAETSVSSSDDSSHSYDNVRESDAISRTSIDAVRRTRLLFFGSRMLYGLFLGMVVGLSSSAQPITLFETPIAACCIATLAIGLIGSWFFFEGRASSYSIVSMPLLVSILAAICFYSRDVASMTRVFVVMTEVVWIAQNIFQLSSYRKMTKTAPTSFALIEYSFQIIPFYITAWAVTSFVRKMHGPLFTGETLAIVELFNLGIIVAVATAAIARHIVRYHPMSSSGANSADPDNLKENTLSIATLAEKYGLTPRELEVLEYLAKGYSRPYIAKMLFISTSTAKTHTKHIYSKLAIDSQDALITLIRNNANEHQHSIEKA